MGGHAVRFYGLSRNTVDYDLHASPDQWDDLPLRLSQSRLAAGRLLAEGPSRRPQHFRRFQVGRLPDGREEWLEFWRQNHLLPPFAELYARREQGIYGGHRIPFLSLPDLIRSKETERAVDWQDVAVLEEFLDARLLAQVGGGRMGLAEALAQLRSRTGFETYLQKDLLGERAAVEQALGRTRWPMTVAYLLPSAPGVTTLSGTAGAIEPVILNRLRAEPPGSPLHLALIEAVRRQYRLTMQARHRADKAALRERDPIFGPGLIPPRSNPNRFS
jgi:hypothetical protein